MVWLVGFTHCGRAVGVEWPSVRLRRLNMFTKRWKSRALLSLWIAGGFILAGACSNADEPVRPSRPHVEVVLDDGSEDVCPSVYVDGPDTRSSDPPPPGSVNNFNYIFAPLLTCPTAGSDRLNFVMQDVPGPLAETYTFHAVNVFQERLDCSAGPCQFVDMVRRTEHGFTHPHAGPECWPVERDSEPTLRECEQTHGDRAPAGASYIGYGGSVGSTRTDGHFEGNLCLAASGPCH